MIWNQNNSGHPLTCSTRGETSPLTFDCNLVLSSVGVSEDLHMNGHLSHSIVHPRA